MKFVEMVNKSYKIVLSDDRWIMEPRNAKCKHVCESVFLQVEDDMNQIHMINFDHIVEVVVDKRKL